MYCIGSFSFIERTRVQVSKIIMQMLTWIVGWWWCCWDTVTRQRSCPGVVAGHEVISVAVVGNHSINLVVMVGNSPTSVVVTDYNLPRMIDHLINYVHDCFLAVLLQAVISEGVIDCGQVCRSDRCSCSQIPGADWVDSGRTHIAGRFSGHMHCADRCSSGGHSCLADRWGGGPCCAHRATHHIHIPVLHSLLIITHFACTVRQFALSKVCQATAHQTRRQTLLHPSLDIIFILNCFIFFIYCFWVQKY